MGRDPAERTAPDLFPTGSASALPAPKAAIESEPPRYVLPKNLHNAVKHLSDHELDLMHAAILEELKRRGRTPQGVETDLPVPPDLTKIQSPPTKTAKLNAAEISLSRGQLNAGAVRIQSRHNAIANCPGVRYSSIGCAAGFGGG
jgi:hypothetical protein